MKIKYIYIHTYVYMYVYIYVYISSSPSVTPCSSKGDCIYRKTWYVNWSSVCVLTMGAEVRKRKNQYLKQKTETHVVERSSQMRCFALQHNHQGKVVRHICDSPHSTEEETEALRDEWQVRDQQPINGQVRTGFQITQVFLRRPLLWLICNICMRSTAQISLSVFMCTRQKWSL